MNRLITCCLFLFFCSFAGFAQQANDVTPDQPVVLNGIEYGFAIRNERKIDISGEPYMRYELSVYVSNKSNCTKLMMPKQTLLGQDDQNLLATFDCLNATGKRLTSKGGRVLAQPFTVPYQQRVKNADGKEVNTTTYVQAGNILRNGETVSNSFIVIVPDGEQPNMKVRIKEIIDL